MRGRLTVLHADGQREDRDLDHEPSFAELDEIVGGSNDLIRGFVRFEGEACIAFCKEDRAKLPLNQRATIALISATLDIGIGVNTIRGDVVIITGAEVLAAMGAS